MPTLRVGSYVSRSLQYFTLVDHETSGPIAVMALGIA
jgi:hypothetical protein